jgi:RNA 3'-terminal phosphate cyclase (ATP)
MIEIDGAIGYGQVLRTSISLSALTLKPIRIFNIRKNRPKPGLAAQHLTGVKVAGEFCNAKVKGLAIGSTEVEFIPQSLNVKDKKIDIGTAGQISLLLQTLAPLLIFSNRETSLEITGGTAGLGAPTIHYVINVTFPLLSKLGVPLPKIEVIREGFYPRGGGLVRIKTYPVKKLSSVKLVERGKVKCIKGVSIAGSLPKDVAERQANAAIKVLKECGFDDIRISSQVASTLSPGTSITLWAECENTVLGNDNIGKKGVKAEIVGEECAKGLIKSIESDAALDKFMSDQIIPFLALADGESEVSVEEFTEHVNTNMLVCEKLLRVKFEKEDKKIKVSGIGFELK